ACADGEKDDTCVASRRVLRPSPQGEKRQRALAPLRMTRVFGAEALVRDGDGDGFGGVDGAVELVDARFVELEGVALPGVDEPRAGAVHGAVFVDDGDLADVVRAEADVDRDLDRRVDGRHLEALGRTGRDDEDEA